MKERNIIKNLAKRSQNNYFFRIMILKCIPLLSQIAEINTLTVFQKDSLKLFWLILVFGNISEMYF